MDRYRYRTKALVGRWRANLDEAVEDAVRAGQARRETGDSSIRWIVTGEIETALGRHVESNEPEDPGHAGGGG